jgi:hypothetical protein
MIRYRALAVVAAVLLSAPLGRAADLDPYLPEDTESVLNLNVRQLLDSELFKKHLLEMAQEALRGEDQVQEVLKELGLDPFKDLDRIVVASPISAEKDRGLIILHGRFDVAKFEAKAKKVAKDNEDHLKIHKILGGKHLLYEVNIPELDDPLFVAIAGRDTILASPGKDYIVDALKKGKDPAKTALKNKKFQALLENVDTRQSLSLAVVPSAEALNKIIGKRPLGDVKDMVAKIQAVGGGLTVSDEVKLQIVVNTKTAADAKEVCASVQAGINAIFAAVALFAQNNDIPGLEFVTKILKGLDVTNKGESVILKGRISSDLIEDALKKKSK